MVPQLDAPYSCGRAVIIAEEPADPFSTSDHAVRVRRDRCFDQFVREALMVALGVVVLDVLGDDGAQMALTEEDDVVEAIISDRPHESLGE
jgi:hypothetical protein